MSEEIEEQNFEEKQRNELYDQHNVSKAGRSAIKYLLPLLERGIDTEERYDIDTRSKVLAEISLYQAYQREPKFKMFAWVAVLLVAYDTIHFLNPAVYGILFIALATINGFISTLRSPAMMAAELEGATDEDGMPADYRAKALSSVNTNITLVLFLIAVSIQLLITSSAIEGELVARNIADGAVNPFITTGVLLFTPILYKRLV